MTIYNLCRDIKPENLLIHESGSLRIADFGCSIQLDSTSNPGGLVTNTAGTMAFWPPEAIIQCLTPFSSSLSPPIADVSGDNMDKEDVTRCPVSAHNVDVLPPLTDDNNVDRNNCDSDAAKDMDGMVAMNRRDDGDMRGEVDADDLSTASSEEDLMLDGAPMMESYDDVNNDVEELPPMMGHYFDTSVDLDTLPPMPLSSTNSSGNVVVEEEKNIVHTDVLTKGSSTVEYSCFGADLWAAGLTIHCFLYGVLPFSIENSNPVDLFDKISSYCPSVHPSSDENSNGTNGKSNSNIYSSRPQQAHTVWSQLLMKDPVQRMSTSKAFESEWLGTESTRRMKYEQD